VSTIWFQHRGELIATPGSHVLAQLYLRNRGTLPGVCFPLHEFIFAFEEDDFAIFSWAMMHRGSEYIRIEGREGQANWRKFVASNSTLCKDAYPIDATYSSKRTSDNSEPWEVGEMARSFFKQAIPYITTNKPLSRW